MYERRGTLVVAPRLSPFSEQGGVPFSPGGLQVDHNAMQDFTQLHGLGLGLAAVPQPTLGYLDPLDKHLFEIA